jgi:hypothetical protein
VIWANQGENGPIYSTQLFRLYRPEGPDSTWQQSNSFSAQELLIVAEVARQCSVWIYEQTQTTREVGW